MGKNHQINLQTYPLFLGVKCNSHYCPCVVMVFDVEIHKTPCLIILAGIKSGKRSRQVAELFGIIKTCDAHCIARAKGLSSGGTLRKVLISRFCGLASKQQYLQLSQQNKQGICDHVLTSSNHQAGSQTNTQTFLHSA